MVTAPYAGSKGQFFWSGVAGTFFWIDPQEELFAVFMSQGPGQREYFRTLIRVWSAAAGGVSDEALVIPGRGQRKWIAGARARRSHMALAPSGLPCRGSGFALPPCGVLARNDEM